MTIDPADEGLRQRAGRLAESGYRIERMPTGWAVRLGERLVGSAAVVGVDMSGEPGRRLLAERLAFALSLAEADKSRLDHLVSFRAEGFVPAEGQTVLDIRTGLVGVARARGRTGFAVECDAEGREGTIRVLRPAADLAPLSPRMAVFDALVEFTNEGEAYGEAAFRVVARNEAEARWTARVASAECLYDDERIPDRHFSVEVEPSPDFLEDVAASLEAFGEDAAPDGPRP